MTDLDKISIICLIIQRITFSECNGSSSFSMLKSPLFGIEKRKYNTLRAGWPVFLMIRCISILPDTFFCNIKKARGENV